MTELGQSKFASGIFDTKQMCLHGNVSYFIGSVHKKLYKIDFTDNSIDFVANFPMSG